jgi:hypothetical protein
VQLTGGCRGGKPARAQAPTKLSDRCEGQRLANVVASMPGWQGASSALLSFHLHVLWLQAEEINDSVNLGQLEVFTYLGVLLGPGWPVWV